MIKREQLPQTLLELVPIALPLLDSQYHRQKQILVPKTGIDLFMSWLHIHSECERIGHYCLPYHYKTCQFPFHTPNEDKSLYFNLNTNSNIPLDSYVTLGLCYKHWAIFMEPLLTTNSHITNPYIKNCIPQDLIESCGLKLYSDTHLLKHKLTLINKDTIDLFLSWLSLHSKCGVLPPYEECSTYNICEILSLGGYPKLSQYQVSDNQTAIGFCDKHWKLFLESL